MKKLSFISKKKEPVQTKLAESQPQAPASGEITQDSDYQLLLNESQSGHWQECQRLISVLEEKYSGNSKLQEFKRDFEFQYSIVKNSEKSAQEKKKKNMVSTTRTFTFILVIIAGLAFITWVGFVLVKNLSQENLLQNKANQINSLSAQVEVLLNSGQPEKAKEIVLLMQTIDAANPKVIDLSTKTDELLKINLLYQNAKGDLQNGQNADALIILQQIESEYPGYRDVSQLIQDTTNKIQIAQDLSDATTAYSQSRWQDTITALEQVLVLDPENSDSNLKEMLLTSYLKRIIEMLQSSNTSFADINQAEIYYRRAIAMIPQSKIYLSERENLQKVSSNLLELKYTQTANNIIADPNQTLISVNQAVIYLQKAASLDPNNTSLQSEVNKINLYQAGFQYYIGMNWPSAIQQFTSLLAIDNNYANGFAKQLLYEAYVARGTQYYSVGFYPDARKQYESAESLVWDKKNLMALFSVEIDLAHTLANLNDFQNAASYFNYAVQAVNYSQRAAASPAFVSALQNAITLYANGNFKDSYNLFDQTLADKSALFTEKTVNVQQGNCLALIAAQYNSSVQGILEKNSLTRQTIVTSTGQLFIPQLLN